MVRSLYAFDTEKTWLMQVSLERRLRRNVRHTGRHISKDERDGKTTRVWMVMVHDILSGCVLVLLNSMVVSSVNPSFHRLYTDAQLHTKHTREAKLRTVS